MSFLKKSMNIFSLHIFTSFTLKSSLESKTNLNILDLEMTELYHHSKIKSALNDIFHWYSQLVMTLRSSLIRAGLSPYFESLRIMMYHQQIFCKSKLLVFISYLYIVKGRYSHIPDIPDTPDIPQRCLAIQNCSLLTILQVIFW